MFKSGVKERITIVRRSAQALDLPLLNNAKDRFVVVPPPTNDEARQTKEPEKKIPGSFHILSKQCCLEYFIVEFVIGVDISIFLLITKAQFSRSCNIFGHFRVDCFTALNNTIGILNTQLHHIFVSRIFQ